VGEQGVREGDLRNPDVLSSRCLVLWVKQLFSVLITVAHLIGLYVSIAPCIAAQYLLFMPYCYSHHRTLLCSAAILVVCLEAVVG